MIKLISRENITDFELMVPALERPLTKTSLGKYWSLQNLFDCIVNFEAFGFIQQQTGYAGAFTIAKSPLRRTLNVFWAGKDLTNKTPIDDDECDRFFMACAEHFQCQAIAIKGRKGWEKMAKRRGYLEDSRVYIKEV